MQLLLHVIQLLKQLGLSSILSFALSYCAISVVCECIARTMFICPPVSVSVRISGYFCKWKCAYACTCFIDYAIMRFTVL